MHFILLNHPCCVLAMTQSVLIRLETGTTHIFKWDRPQRVTEQFPLFMGKGYCSAIGIPLWRPLFFFRDGSQNKFLDALTYKKVQMTQSIASGFPPNSPQLRTPLSRGQAQSQGNYAFSPGLKQTVGSPCIKMNCFTSFIPQKWDTAEIQ